MRISCRLISETVSVASGVPLRELHSDRRDAAVVNWRHASWYLARHMTPFSLPQIGRHMGGRDHTTILHGIRKIEAALTSSSELQETITTLSDAVTMAALSLDRLSADAFPDLDPVDIAERILNARIRDHQPSLDDVRALAMGVSHYAREVEVLEHQLVITNRDGIEPGMSAPVMAIESLQCRELEALQALRISAEKVVKAHRAAEQCRYSPGEKAAQIKFQATISELKTHFEGSGS
jgi:hypothetical protein